MRRRAQRRYDNPFHMIVSQGIQVQPPRAYNKQLRGEKETTKEGQLYSKTKSKVERCYDNPFLMIASQGTQAQPPRD